MTTTRETMSVKAAATALHVKPNQVRRMTELGLLRPIGDQPVDVVFVADVETVAAEMEAKRTAPHVDAPTMELDFA